MLSVSELPSSLAWDQGLLKTQDYANFGPGLSSDRESEYQWERDSCGLNILTLTAAVISSIRMGLEEERETYILSSWDTSDAQDAVLGADAISSPRKCVVLCLAPDCPSQQFIAPRELLLTSRKKRTNNYWC